MGPYQSFSILCLVSKTHEPHSSLKERMFQLGGNISSMYCKKEVTEEAVLGPGKFIPE